MECKCNLREKLVGDGCESCNPAKALEYAKETIADLETLLRVIGDYAHEHSTGPETPDALWTVHEMACGLM